MLEWQLEYERVREAESRKAHLEAEEKVRVPHSVYMQVTCLILVVQERLRAQLASSLSVNHTVSHQEVRYRVYVQLYMYMCTLHTDTCRC